MKSTLRLTAAAVILAMTARCFAADMPGAWKELAVPAEISTKQEIVSTPESWSAGKEDYPNRLAAIAISNGPPENRVLLVYSDFVEHKNKQIATWRLASGPNDHFWISCNYTWTNIIVKKPLPDGIKELRVFYDTEVKPAGLPTVERIEYR
jgi:hypothetical protein